MKKISLSIFAVVLIFSQLQAQTFRGSDKSAMDMSYFPDHFAHDRKFAPEKVGDKAFIRITYSRPAKKEREVFGKLVPYNTVWRVGANENTEIKFYQNVNIGGKKLKAGTYSMFIIPTETDWTVIFNSDLDEWGAYRYNQAHDVLRVKASLKPLADALDNLSIQFTKGAENEAIMQLGWDKTLMELPISIK
jgi:Protein of unknown function (DUF2911)